jgi:hypothetical protein
VFSEIIAAAADYEQSNRTQPMPRQRRQADDAAAQNWGVCSQVPCRGRPGLNREYSAIGALFSSVEVHGTLCSCGANSVDVGAAHGKSNGLRMLSGLDLDVPA